MFTIMSPYRIYFSIMVQDPKVRILNQYTEINSCCFLARDTVSVTLDILYFLPGLNFQVIEIEL